MAFKILTENSVDNTNIDGARAEHFNAGLRDGIVKGAFNEGIFSALASNVISFDTCELRISGHRVIIDEIWTQTFSSSPSVATRYALVGQIVVDSSSNVDFSLFVQNAATQLVKDNLFRTENGAGTYQVEIGRFTLTTNGTIADVVRTLDTITGGSSGKGEHFISGNMTTVMLESGMQANVIAEDQYNANGEYEQTNMTWELPETAGTVVKVNNVEQANLDFTSDPQTQLNNKVNKSDIDSALSSSSENPVQNKKVKEALDNKADTSNVYTKTESVNLLLDKVYPVNSIYMSVANVSPASFLGGTWEQLKDRFLLGAGDTYSNGATDGSSTHYHQTGLGFADRGDNNLVGIKTSPYNRGNVISATTNLWHEEGGGNASWANVKTTTTADANNMPPYLVVYMWKRTA